MPGQHRATSKKPGRIRVVAHRIWARLGHGFQTFGYWSWRGSVYYNPTYDYGPPDDSTILRERLWEAALGSETEAEKNAIEWLTNRDESTLPHLNPTAPMSVADTLVTEEPVAD